MADINWGFIQDGGAFESLMHAICYAEDPGTILFGRPGKDAGQDARSEDGTTIFQAKYRQNLLMEGAIQLALQELAKIKKYKDQQHPNHVHWRNARHWTLVANILTNPNDEADWRSKVVPEFEKEGLVAKFWGIEILDSKLAKLPHVRDIFFESENRILVGLKEAHDRLSNECIGSASLTKLFVGRINELQAINDFVEVTEKRVLPIIGVAGIGKSRLTYEAVVNLSQKGWRVLWALPEAMSRSSKWFQYLNSNQPTCVVVDDPSDPKLLAAIIEQLAPVERRNWKVIVACRSSQAEIFRPFAKWALLSPILKLVELSEESSKELILSNLNIPIADAQIHTIYKNTGGNPGWLCLVAELSNSQTLRDLPHSVDGIAAAYIAECIGKFHAEDKQYVLLTMRYLALWGTFSLGSGVEEESQAKFLSSQGLPDLMLRRLLVRLVEIGIVRNWGIGKRLFAIQPLIVREYILSEWLFSLDNGEYHVNAEGKRIIELLVQGTVPATGLALRSISHLTRSRLGMSQGYSFVKPVFDELRRIAVSGTVLDQDRLLTLVELFGAADPESALYVCKNIREHPQIAVEIKDEFWGKATLTHDSVLAKLPWTLFKIATFIHDQQVARRYLEEFRTLLILEPNIHEKIEEGKKPAKLLERMLRESKNAYIYSAPSSQIVENELGNPASWPFVGIILECLIHPEREFTEWTAQWTLTFNRRTLLPKSPDWDEAMRLRRIAFDALSTDTNSELRPKIWQIIAESHQEFHRLLLHGRVQGMMADEYTALLLDDLTTSARILEQPPVRLDIKEIVCARAMWAWYLDYGKSEKLINLAKRCESACKIGTVWHPEDFFRFDTDEALAPETQRVAAIFRNANDERPFVEFFAESKAYLDAIRAGRSDMADSFRITALADALSDAFQTFTVPRINSLSLFVRKTLQQQQILNDLEWAFAVRLCQRHILRIKTEYSEKEVTKNLQLLLAECHHKERFLLDIYSNPHPLNTGMLTLGEFHCIFANEFNYTTRQNFILLGIFAPTFWEVVNIRLVKMTDVLKSQSEELGNCIAAFLRMMHLTALRYNHRNLTAQITWILDMISEHDLDGRILGMYELKWLREKSNCFLSISDLMKLIRGRMESEKTPKVSVSFRTLPFEFQIRDWCRFDLTQDNDAKIFKEFCGLALEDGFLALHFMPKFIGEIDPSGLFVANFIQEYLRKNLSLAADSLARLAFIASAYADSTAAWALCATPICVKIALLERQERERVFMGLARKETGVLTSAPGEVPRYYFEMREIALKLLSAEKPDSPLREYREWAFRRAEADLQFEQQRNEEVKND